MDRERISTRRAGSPMYFLSRPAEAWRSALAHDATRPAGDSAVAPRRTVLWSGD
jgi:hypothetical protein